MSFYEITNNKGDKTAKIDIHSQIGVNWFGEGVESQGFIDELNAIGKVDKLDVHINSTGGNVSDGVAIYNTLKQHKAKVTTYVDGLAASIASVIAMAGDEIIMPLGSTMFIHDPLTWSIGNADYMRDTAQELDKIKDSIIDIYANQASISRDEISDLMSKETTMTADEALAFGFATKVEKYEDGKFMNGTVFNKDDMKSQVMLMASVESSEKTIKSLQSKLAQANKKISEFEKKPKAADAKEIIAYCKQHNVADLANTLIESDSTMDAVKIKVNLASQVSDICAAANIDSTRIVASIHSPVEMLQNALNAQAVALDSDIDNHLQDKQDEDGWNKAREKVNSMNSMFK